MRSEAAWRTVLGRSHACQEEQEAARTTPAFSADAETSRFVTLMAAQVVKKLPEGDDWIDELKFDGYPALVIEDRQQLELRSRKNKDLTGMYRGVAEAGQRVKAAQAVIDGEIVALDTQGSPSFQALQHRDSHPGEEMREMQWVKPEVVGQIRFVEWTTEGRLRHAAFLGLRSDKRASEVHREN